MIDAPRRRMVILWNELLPGLIFLFVVIGVIVVITGKGVLVLLVFRVIFRFQLERTHAHHLQVRAAFVTTQRISLVDVSLIHVDLGVAFRAKHHTKYPQPTLYETCAWMPRAKI